MHHGTNIDWLNRLLDVTSYISILTSIFNFADVFRKFEKEGKFFCLAGQSNQAVTGMFNLYRASQVSFPGEKILEDARTFSRGFLREKQIAKQLLDKWIIASDLPGEVTYSYSFLLHLFIVKKKKGCSVSM